ncbi:MAG: exodeoxyribonuclease V subunit alpha [Thiohalocapsa sp.]|nr:exodeoxyribonuclease V subunit alpha [Thiohalocapsa sp.]
MSNRLHRLMETGRLSPLSYHFARFVAERCGLGEDSPLALAAALVSARNLEGDVCIDLARFAGCPLFRDESDAEAEADAEAPVLAPTAPALADWLEALRAAPWVGAPGQGTPLVLDGERLYLGKYWRFEQQVADALLARMAPVPDLDVEGLAGALAQLFPDTTGEPDWQKAAAAIAASRRFAVVSGGPGTGKTTTVVKVLALLLEQYPALRIALAAPTGKAGARLTEAIRGGKRRVPAAEDVLARIPETAVTIHRLLGYGPNGFRYNRDNPLPADCLVVDEASMVDLPLMARLLDALSPDTRVILLGDRDQLASVEAGAVLGDITGHGRELRCSPAQAVLLEQLGAVPAGALPTAASAPPAADAVGLLRVSYRFDASSGIGALARAVNAGRGDDALALFAQGRFEDIAWLDAGEEAVHPDCIARAVDRYAACLAQSDVAEALRLFEQTRVLAALYRGPFGVEELNRRIAAGLQARGAIRLPPRGDGGDYHGKPVIVRANDYEVGLFNGDIGLLWRDGEGEGDGPLRAWFPGPEGGVRAVSVRQLPDHDTAFALTVHKSQGSEFDEVLLVLPAAPSPVLTRELIYTGVTRARRRVTVHAAPAVFASACRARVQRSSALAERLGWLPVD